MGTTGALSLSAVVALIGLILAAIAFGTNSWRTYTVNRNAMLAENPDWHAKTDDIFYSRTFGFFRECFTGEEPPIATIYDSPLGYRCIHIKYDDEIRPNMPDRVKEYIHLKKTYLAFYIVGLTLGFIGMLLLIAACGKRSSTLVIVSGAVVFLAGSFIAASIGIWHRVWYIIENDFVFNEGTWQADPMMAQGGLSEDLRAFTLVNPYYWSLVVAWVSVALLLLGGILMCAAAGISKKESSVYQSEGDNIQVLYPPGSPGYSYDKSYGMVPYGYYDYSTYSPYGAYYSPYAYYGPYAYSGYAYTR